MSGTLCLVATIAGRAVAVPAELVEAVVDLPRLIPVPGADPTVVGLAALRSRVVTVLDARRVLGAPPHATNRALLLRAEGHEYALLVDDCADIAPFTIHPVPVGMAFEPAWRAIARGVVEHGGTPLLLIAPAALVPRPVAA